MSASASGAPQPQNQPPGGNGPSKQPSDDSDPPIWPLQREQNGHNNWTKNSKIKTAKCDICSERVKIYSWNCDRCLKRICSGCAEDNGGSSAQYKHIARNNLDKKCNCFYAATGGQAPEIQPELQRMGLVRPPPLRKDEDAKNKKIKEDVTKRKKKQVEEAAKSGAADGGKAKKQKTGTENADPASASKSRSNIVNAALPCPHLDQGGTVIVGSGIIGLCIARELALAAKDTGTHHTITVVEIRSGCGELASSSCAGILSVSGLDSQLDSLVDVALDGWLGIAGEQGFEAATDFVRDNVYRVRRGEDYRPSWYTRHGNEEFMQDNDFMGKIDTAKFSTWLYEQCRELKVGFCFNHDVHNILGDTSQDVCGIEVQRIRHAGDRNGPRRTLDCQNVVLAAGPWSKDIFKHVYLRSKLEIENHVKAALWTCVTTIDLPAEDNVGLVFPDIAAEETLLDDEMVMAARPPKHQIIIAGLRAGSASGVVNSIEALTPPGIDAKPHHRLQRLAGKRLNKGEDVMRPDNATTGFALVSTSVDNLPIIDKVPASGLGRVFSPMEEERPNGVWLCFGFGMYGTTLGPGAARALCRRMFGEPSGILDHAVAIPTYQSPVAGASSSST